MKKLPRGPMVIDVKSSRLLNMSMVVGLVVMLAIPNTNVTGLSDWNETGIDFPKGQFNNTRVQNDSLVLDADPSTLNNWTKVGDASSPPPRCSHSIVYDALNGEHLLFGGHWTLDNLYQDTWTYNMSNNKWIDRAPVISPGIRQSHTLAFDSNYGISVMFGGLDYSDNSTWIYNLTQNMWAESKALPAPTPRTDHGMVYDPGPGYIVLFGGFSRTGSELTTFNDTWVYDYGANAWTNRTPPTAPEKRFGHSMCYDPESGLIILFGGRNETFIFHDTWTYNATSNIWTEESPAISPSGRYGASMAQENVSGRVILIGGHDGDTVLNDTWAYNATRETWIYDGIASGMPPRLNFSVTFDTRLSMLLVFGGEDQNGDCLDDFWTYDLASRIWEKIGEISSPIPRTDFGMAYDRNSMVGILFGGLGYSSMLYNDTWTYNARENRWTRMRPPTAPSTRYKTVMCYDSDTDLIVLYGGQESAYGPAGNIGDTWTYSLESNNWTFKQKAFIVSIGACCLEYCPITHRVLLFAGVKSELGETWAYDVVANNWSQITTGWAPSSRYDAKMVYDEAERKVVLFGGYLNNHRMADTWAFDPIALNWTQMYPMFPPSARSRFAMAYDANRGAVLLHGGDGINSNNDTWTYNLSRNVWTNIKTAVAPSQRYGQGMFYDRQSALMITFGGYDRYGYKGDSWVFGLASRFREGSYTSTPKDLGGEAYFGNLEWNASLPGGTSIGFQLRTGTNRTVMEANEFTGPDGSPATQFNSSGEIIPTMHNGSHWMQYRAYFRTDDILVTPVLESVTINYNLIQQIKIISPIGNENWTGFQNITWSANDMDDDKLGFTVFLENETSSYPLISGLSEDERRWSWNTDTIPNGTYRIRVLARDDNPSIPLDVNATSDNFTIYHPIPPIPPNDPPRVILVSPSNNSYIKLETAQLRWIGMDPDNDFLTYKVYISDNKLDVISAIHNTTTNMQFEISGLNDNTTYFWTVDAWDGKLTCADFPSQIWCFTVKLPPANIPVRINSTPFNKAWVGKDYYYNITAIDEDGDLLEFGLVQAPAAMTLNRTSGKLHWISTEADLGNRSVTVQVSDGRGSIDRQTFTISVVEDSVPPPPIKNPACVILFPANGTKVHGKVVVKGMALSGSSPVTDVNIRLDGKGWTAVAGLENWTFIIDTLGLKNGRHRLEARASDGTRYSNMTSIDIVVFNAEPTVYVEWNQMCLLAFILISIIIFIIVLSLIYRKDK